MAKKQFNNERTCIVCREKDAKSNMLRFVIDENLNVIFDEKQLMEGRGAYIHCKNKCLKALRANNVILKAFKHAFRLSKDSKINVDAKLDYEALSNLIVVNEDF